MAPPQQRGDRKAIWAWSLYDFANSSFTTLVITFIYATYFVKGIAADETTGTVLWAWGVVTPTAIVVAVFSPLLGALADRTGTRKRALLITTVVTRGRRRRSCSSPSAATCSGHRAGGRGEHRLRGRPGVLQRVPARDRPAGQDRPGLGLGWALGYVGGLLCMALALALVMPEVAPFGLDKATGEHVRVTNLLVAGWFALFSIPAFLVLTRAPSEGGAQRGVMRATFGELGETFRRAPPVPPDRAAARSPGCSTTTGW